jgi:uncharacterized RDD family membrane protein YckC
MNGEGKRDMVQCSLCKREFEEEAVIKAGDYRVCAECKPLFFQRLREGLSLTGEMTYGGFWIRFGARMVDSILLLAVGVLLMVAGGFGKGSFLLRLLGYPIAIAYETYFVGRYGATLGKMACGLKVVRSEGQNVSYGRAFGRYWACLLSSMTLTIGYIMAAFDSQKRALHDRICDTRVIRT